MKLSYKQTVLTCYISYIASAAANNLVSLLFIIFQDDFGLSNIQLATVVSANFFTQIILDLIGAKYVDKVGYRPIALIGSAFLVIGLISIGLIPMIISNTFVALCIASVIYAIGSGLNEVIISPIIEALPGEQKEAAMSILHSFYCWGHVGVVLLSTLYFVVVPDKWFILPMLWAIVPLISLILFTSVPIRILNEDSESQSLPFSTLFKNKLFWLFCLLMLCGGAAEQCMSQWSSFFAESELGVSKLIGNLLGPCFFALMMAITRTIYGKYSEKMPLISALLLSSIITVAGYLMSSLIPNPYIALIGCGIVGVGVGLYWPGVLSVSSNAIPAGGASMFALLALFGDLGCSVGPQLTAVVSEIFGGRLKAGLFASIIFPIVIGVSMFLYIKRKRMKV